MPAHANMVDGHAYTICIHQKPSFVKILTCSPNELTTFPRTLWMFMKSIAKAAAMTPTAAPAEFREVCCKAQWERTAAAFTIMQQLRN